TGREDREDHGDGESREVIPGPVQAVERAGQGGDGHDDQEGERSGPETGAVTATARRGRIDVGRRTYGGGGHCGHQTFGIVVLPSLRPLAGAGWSGLLPCSGWPP